MCLVETMRKLGENEDGVPAYITEERSFPVARHHFERLGGVVDEDYWLVGSQSPTRIPISELHTSHAGLYDVVVGRVYWPRLPGVDDEILDPGVGREGMYRQVDQ